MRRIGKSKQHLGTRRVSTFLPTNPAATNYMSTASARALRETLRAEHTIGTGEGGFVGFSSRTGFTTVIVTSATALVTAINAMAVSDKKIFKCQWNGVSNPASYSINGPSNASMTANGAIDWGYNRPDWSAIIEPDTGYAPTIGIASGNIGLSFSGTHWMEFNDLTFTGDVELYPSTGYRNGIAIVAMNRCNIQRVLSASNIRTMHLKDCVTTGANATLNVVANYYRVWSHASNAQTNATDFTHNFGFSEAFTSTWIAHTWLAGVTVQNMQQVVSGNHYDGHQYMLTGDPVIGYHILHEFCVFNGNSEDSQGLWVANIIPGMQNTILSHNSIYVVNAYWALGLVDPSGAGTCIADSILCMRGGVGPGPTAPVYDTVPRIGCIGNAVNAGGKFEVTSSYFFDIPTTHVYTQDVAVPITLANNIHIDPTLGATVGTRPQDRLTGNGTWSTNVSGFTSFTSPDIGVTDQVAANTAFLAFAKPAGGWRTAGAGPVDPSTWPTSYNTTLT